MQTTARLFFAALCFFLFSVSANVVSAESWTPIECPEAPQPLAQQFETVRVLEDFEDGIGSWKSILGDQQARSETAAEPEGGHGGSRALQVDYEFFGKEEYEYVAFGGDTILEGPGKSLGFWYRFRSDPLALRVRLADRSGEVHQLDVPQTEAEGWQFTAVKIATQGGCWGGDGNKQLDFPVRLDSIVADRPQHGYVGSGTLWIDDIALVQPVRKSHKLAIEVEAPRLGNVYEPGETVRLRVRGEGGRIRWTATDYSGRTIAEGASNEQPALIELCLPRSGYYECRMELAGDGSTIDSRIFACAALPEPGDRENSFVGMGCHFRRNAYPLECMDLLVRYGFREFRDEISWSGVEREKGRYEIPEYGAEFVARSGQLGLNPLLICDYSNRFYDDGGFPNSDEAVAAYAKYCRQLARRFRGNVSQFEIWNEWSIGCGMRDKPGENTPEAYAKLIQPAWKAIKQANPEARVVGLGGEHSAHHFEQIRGMFRSGAAGAMDVFSVHSYRYPRTPEESELVEEIEKVVEMAVANGGPGKVWITEIGWPTHLGKRGVDEPAQARIFVRALALLRSIEAVEKVYWYDFKDDGLDRNYNENNFGLIHHQRYALAPKPGVVAASVFARMTAGAKPHRLWQKDDACAVILKLPEGGELAIAWSTGGESETDVPDDIAAFDLMGNPFGSATVKLTPDPVYLRSPGQIDLFR